MQFSFLLVARSRTLRADHTVVREREGEIGVHDGRLHSRAKILAVSRFRVERAKAKSANSSGAATRRSSNITAKFAARTRCGGWKNLSSCRPRGSTASNNRLDFGADFLALVPAVVVPNFFGRGSCLGTWRYLMSVNP